MFARKDRRMLLGLALVAIAIIIVAIAIGTKAYVLSLEAFAPGLTGMVIILTEVLAELVK